MNRIYTAPLESYPQEFTPASRRDYLQWKDATRAQLRQLTGNRINSATGMADWPGLYAGKLEPLEAAKRIVAQVRAFLNDLVL